MSSHSPTTPASLPVLLLRQTAAILLDAYRELQSKKLFWITLILSGLLVAAFGCVGFNERGVSILWKTFEQPTFNSNIIPVAAFYKDLFIRFGVNLWLTYFAIILALVSTAPIFPDFLSGGAIDLYLARPIGRTRLFLTKYTVGLLFVALQVVVFCAASFIVIGIRGGVWVPGLFLAVPVTVLMYSYLWSICTFFAVLTRSTVASLLLTCVTWTLIFLVHGAEVLLVHQVSEAEAVVTVARQDVARFERDIASLTTRPATTRPGTLEAARRRQLEAMLEAAKVKAAVDGESSYVIWRRVVTALKFPLPKTSETPQLLERWINHQFKETRYSAREERASNRQIERENTDDARPSPRGRNDGNFRFFGDPRIDVAADKATEAFYSSRTNAWIVGTSLAFEAIILAIAAFIFSRRDF